MKYDILVEKTPSKNRFEICLKNERAYYVLRDLLTYHDAELTDFPLSTVIYVLLTKTKQNVVANGRQMSVGLGLSVRIVVG